MQKYKTILILILLFAISIVIRFQNIDRPLSEHHEWITAHTLITLQIWNDDGISKFNYNPVFTYHNKGDQFQSDLGRLPDAENNYYYVSYPPFAFLFPYFTFQVFNISPTVVSLQIFNILLHFIACLFVYRIISLVYNFNDKGKIFYPAMVGTLFYMFMPTTLWYHTNIYFVDILVQTIWIIGIFILLKIIIHKQHSVKWIIGLGVVNFFMIYTEWIGIFFSLLTCLICLVKLRSQKVYTKILLSIIVSTVAAILLIAMQYSTICGFECLMNELTSKYLYRSGTSNLTDRNLSLFNFQSYKEIFTSYVWEFSPYFLMMLVLFLITTTLIYRKSIKKLLNQSELLLIILCIVPVQLHHFIFFNFTSIHSFSTFKTSLFFSILLSVIYYKLLDQKKLFLNIGIGITLVFCIVHYYKINNRDYIDPKYETVGTEIRKAAKPDEVVIVTGTDAEYLICPQLHFYAKRNVTFCDNMEEVKSFLVKFNQQKAVVFQMTPDREIIDIQRITI
ncbi:MAG: hypothetical protein JKY33_01785 [Bacteroidia bacterium]|nr:hypothetical protein [Bacteroidia bacterium]